MQLLSGSGLAPDALIETLDGINDSQEETQRLLDKFDATPRWRRRRRLVILARIQNEQEYREALWERLGYPPEFWDSDAEA